MPAVTGLSQAQIKFCFCNKKTSDFIHLCIYILFLDIKKLNSKSYMLCKHHHLYFL